MVRLVFRPYTQVWRSICTLESLRASTRVSPGFTLLKHSSPSFGSYQICSYSNPSQKIKVGRCCPLRFASCTSFQCAYEFLHSQTRICDRLLGPCFKTGQYEPSWQDRTKRPQSSRPFGVKAESKPPTFSTLILVSLNPSCLLPPKSQKTSLGIR